ncbi:hypothetical protein D3876_10455 [Sphingomonas cavernae]|uniref:Uncharacterized protein n=1 Tax=Sphingomonas cavernae TaxID=2320861 RepID=A0A418WL06_9SPHN|nr:hypothetical protein D3876_10455 [Sphingomonas cavernae]
MGFPRPRIFFGRDDVDLAERGALRSGVIVQLRPMDASPRIGPNCFNIVGGRLSLGRRRDPVSSRKMP